MTNPPVLQIVGHSDSGKTTLITALVTRLTDQGYRVGTVKHHSKDLELDTPGKDSWRHRRAGAAPVTLVARGQAAVFYPKPPALGDLLAHYRGTDLVLVEGFKNAHFPKWALLKAGEDPAWLEGLANIEAVVTPDPAAGFPWPAYRPGETDRMAADLMRRIGPKG